MPKREYIGDPIDATMSYIKEARSGKTVGGTTEDDKGKETTTAMPNVIDEDQYTDDEVEKVQNRILHPDSSLKEFCERFQYHYANTSKFFTEFRREHKPELQEANVYEKLVPPKNRGKGSTQTTQSGISDDVQEQLEKYYKANPDAGAHDAIQEFDLELNASQVGAIKGNLIQYEGLDNESESESDVGNPWEKDIATIRKRMQAIEQTVESLQTDDSGNSDEVSRDTVFAIVSGEELTDEQRREVFDVYVG